LLYKTEGIALSYIKYKESSIIAKIYTAEFGLQTYIQNGVRTEKSKTKISLFQPLTLLDIVVYHKPNIEIHRIKEIKCSFIYKNIQTDYVKICICSFVSELLSKTLKENEKSETLFYFLKQTFINLDEASHLEVRYFPLEFMLRYFKTLGILSDNYQDFVSELSINKPIVDQLLLNKELSTLIEQFFEKDALLSSVTQETLRSAVDIMLVYLNIHNHADVTLKSLRVLRAL
jgi:DNA repair protein RecO (recombination protein O)